MCGYKNSRLDKKWIWTSISLLASRFSWAGVLLGCLVTLRLQLSWHRIEACLIPRHFEQRAEDVVEQFLLSCCLSRHCQPTRGFQQIGIPRQQLSTLVPLNQFCQHNVPCGENDELCQLEIEVQPWMIWSWTWPWLCLLFLVQTWWFLISTV